LFAQYGTVLSVRQIRDERNESVGHGIVEMDIVEKDAEDLLLLDRPMVAGKRPLIWRPRQVKTSRSA
jgi:hypothetical protein